MMMIDRDDSADARGDEFFIADDPLAVPRDRDPDLIANFQVPVASETHEASALGNVRRFTRSSGGSAGEADLAFADNVLAIEVSLVVRIQLVHAVDSRAGLLDTLLIDPGASGIYSEEPKKQQSGRGGEQKRL